jgi:hypothetical protein
MPITVLAFSNNEKQKAEPINPAAPVTSIFINQY